MKFPLYLAVRNLLRHPGRNFLYILGVSITAALLLDMILLSGGIRVTLLRVLTEMGYEIRLSPRGTLPFETDAQIFEYGKVQKRLSQIPSVDYVDALLGTSVVAHFGKETFTSFAMGLQQRKAVLYRITAGHEPRPGAMEILVNQYLAAEKKIRPGDTLKLWTASRYQTTGVTDSIEVTVSGAGFFHLDAEGQFTMSCPLPLLQELMGQTEQDPVSLIMIKLHDSSHAKKITEQIDAQFPQFSAYTIDSVIDAVDQQLSYFKQFAYILGGISLVVTFVLVFIITTISFHDRIGEIALLKAIGLSNKTIFSTIVLEGILISFASAVFGFLLGKIVAIYLDMILKSAPGLPEDFSFFVMEPDSLMKALVTLLLTGFFAGIYPASAAVRLPVADTLREEIL